MRRVMGGVETCHSLGGKRMGRKEKQVLRVGACQGEAKQQFGESWFECRFWRSDADVRYNITLALDRGSGFVREFPKIVYNELAMEHEIDEKDIIDGMKQMLASKNK
jgi:hypothetical protein